MVTTRRKLAIMWIEDQIEPFIVGLEVLIEELRSRGFELADERLEARTVEDAERMLDDCEISAPKPDVILLDLMLPQDQEDLRQSKVDLDGGYLIWFELRKMQKWPTLAEVPVLIITARGRPEYRDQVTSDPATKWLSKPAAPSEVAEIIKQLLTPSDAARQPLREQPSANANDWNPTPPVG
jgi:CheY-like chemotaxis protein